MGGGVWRLRPESGNKLLVAAMANILQENRGHDSLAHGADWVTETDIVTVSWPCVHSTIVSLPSGASLNECQLYSWPSVLSWDGIIINRIIIVASVHCARLSGITTDSFG